MNKASWRPDGSHAMRRDFNSRPFAVIGGEKFGMDEAVVNIFERRMMLRVKMFMTERLCLNT
jgi:hypothetical protein